MEKSHQRIEWVPNLEALSPQTPRDESPIPLLPYPQVDSDTSICQEVAQLLSEFFPTTDASLLESVANEAMTCMDTEWLLRAETGARVAARPEDLALPVSDTYVEFMDWTVDKRKDTDIASVGLNPTDEPNFDGLLLVFQNSYRFN
jgi:hypothetical protein